MSTPGQPQQIPMVAIQCGKCQGPLMVRIPVFHIFNQLDVSAIIFQHARFEKCPNCATQYVCLMKGVTPTGQIDLMWSSVETNESAIVPPTPENMAAAQAAQQAAKEATDGKLIKLA